MPSHVTTMFMSKTGGFCSGSQDKKIVVIGKMNRPFDLGCVVPRKLARRLLIGLPGEKEFRRRVSNILLRVYVTERMQTDPNRTTKRTGNFPGCNPKHVLTLPEDNFQLQLHLQ